MARRPRAALRCALALAALRVAGSCSYDQSVGTGLSCAAAPLAATSGNEEDAPGGVVNLGGTGQPSVYAIFSDWGGQGVPPYTTAGQVAASKAMNAVCNAQACKAVLSAGNNFLPAGLPADTTANGTANASTRFDSTWNALYGQGPALAVPWYLTGGYRDWQGNITAERDLSVANTASGVMTWHYPGARACCGAVTQCRQTHARGGRPLAEPQLHRATRIQARARAGCSAQDARL